jgi:hypothetical protein
MPSAVTAADVKPHHQSLPNIKGRMILSTVMAVLQKHP